MRALIFALLLASCGGTGGPALEACHKVCELEHSCFAALDSTPCNAVCEGMSGACATNAGFAVKLTSCANATCDAEPQCTALAFRDHPDCGHAAKQPPSTVGPTLLSLPE
jgi:hypothetical protein